MGPSRVLCWAPRISREKVRQFYEAAARGDLGEEMIDEVGTTLYRRCQSILRVTEAHMEGRIACPWCGHVIFRQGDREEVLTCEQCSWNIRWRDYFRSYHKKQLVVASAIDVIGDFVRRFPEAHARAEKVLLIDELIHKCHFHLKPENPVRVVAVNLIQGKAKELRAFLDELAGGPKEEAT